MKNMIHIRNSVIIILCITVILLGIGFIILSVELNKKNEENHSLNVVFTDIKKASTVKGSNKEPTSRAEIITNGSEVDMDFTLNSTHDEITYIATIENKGTMPCEIVDIMESPDYNIAEYRKLISPITVNITNVKGKIIPPGDKINVKVVVYYNTSTEPVVPRSFSYKIGIITKSR